MGRWACCRLGREANRASAKVQAEVAQLDQASDQRGCSG